MKLSASVQKILILLFLAVITFNICSFLYSVKDIYLRSNYWDRYAELKKTYYDSVYANKKGPFIPDEVVYSFSAGSLIKGVSPIFVNPETPPLGKYIISLSILFFNNENIGTLVIGLASLYLLYQLGKQIFSSVVLALIPVLLLTFEPLFLNQFRYTPLLDIIQLFFLLCFFFLFNKAVISKKYVLYFLLASCMAGGFISVKFFGSGLTLIGAALTVLFLRRQFKKSILFLITFLVAPLILLINYVSVLLSGYSFSAFLGVQKWIFLYNQGHVTKGFTFFPLFLFNHWHSWWGVAGTILSDDQWRLTWPLSLVCLLIVLFCYLRGPRYRQKSLDIVLGWVVIYIGLLQIGYTTTRYFVILVPPMFIIMVYGIRVFVLYARSRK